MHKLHLIYNPNQVIEAIIERTLKKQNVLFKYDRMGLVILGQPIPELQLSKITAELGEYNIEIAKQDDANLIEQIKNCLKMVINDSEERKKKISVVLSEKLDLKYAFLSKHFVNETYTTIEKFYLMLKIEKAKELLLKKDVTVAEVALDLDYSSTSHLSRQFKNVTGLSVSQYLKLIEFRRANYKL